MGFFVMRQMGVLMQQNSACKRHESQGRLIDYSRNR